MTALAWRLTMLRGVRELPKAADDEAALGCEAAVTLPAVEAAR
jgi:hypothetical protein